MVAMRVDHVEIGECNQPNLYMDDSDGMYVCRIGVGQSLWLLAE
jgi:hypothetical protein